MSPSVYPSIASESALSVFCFHPCIPSIPGPFPRFTLSRHDDHCPSSPMIHGAPAQKATNASSFSTLSFRTGTARSGRATLTHPIRVGLLETRVTVEVSGVLQKESTTLYSAV